MKCCGIELSRVCEVVQVGANGSEWCQATVALGQLRLEIPPERATRMYIHWGNHSQKEERKRHHADVQYDLGCKYVVLRCLSFAKGKGLLESRGRSGGKREYRLTDKGNQLIQEGAICQP